MAVASSVDCRPSSKVELSISCSNLQDKDFFSKSDPMAVLYVKKNGKFEEYGKTEWQQNTLNPNFATTIEMGYYFEEVQQLKFFVYDLDNDTSSLDDDDFLGSLECTLGEIVSSSPFTRDLAGGGGKKSKGKLGTITVRVEELSKDQLEIEMKFEAEHLDKKDFFGKSDPYLEFSKKNPDGSFTPIYKTEVIKNTLYPVWRPIIIKSQKLCNSEPKRTIRVTCYDWDSDGSHDLIGFFDTNLAELVEAGEDKSWDCINPEKQKKKKKYKNSGVVKITRFIVTKLYSFLEYIMGGCQINFTVGIDFTISNDDPTDPTSLHYLDPNKPNQYTSALVAVGEVCQYYDSDKLFPALGFGGKVNEEVSHEFALNGNPSNPYCAGIPGVVAAYHEAIRSVKLWGPTNFAPIINHVARFAAEAKKNVEVQQYFVLLMLTDGDISDMTDTMKAIIAASYLPMSIIIVGVGMANFHAMRELDSDGAMLTCDEEEAGRDIVQFVPFRDFLDASPEALASAVLAEVPGQLTEYMKENDIVPRKL